MTTFSHSPATTPLAFATGRSSGRISHVFQPPKSPSSPNNTPSLATSSDYFSYGSRKRQRPDSSHSADSRTPRSVTPNQQRQCPTPSDGSYVSANASGYGQDSAFVNERYRLAGGYDTPSLMATAEMERLHMNSEPDQRRWRGDRTASGLPNTFHTPLSGPLAKERNGIGRMHSFSSDAPKKTWTGLAFNLVGKVFTFSTSVFRGFYAGGGKGYSLDQDSTTTDMWRSQERCSTPLPGSWEQNDFLGDFEQDNPHSPPTSSIRPPNKRRQTDREQWVMVGTPDLTNEPSSPRRKLSSNSASRINSSLNTAQHRPSASRASSRRSIAAPISRRQSSHITYTGSPVTTTTTHQNQPHPSQISHAPLDRRASFAPMRSGNTPTHPTSSRPNSSSGVLNAYISPEAERYVKRRVKQDRQADATMSEMSRKLAELIRQGQAALGTEVTIEGGGGGLGEEEDELMDEGFVDEDW